MSPVLTRRAVSSPTIELKPLTPPVKAMGEAVLELEPVAIVPDHEEVRESDPESEDFEPDEPEPDPDPDP